MTRHALTAAVLLLLPALAAAGPIRVRLDARVTGPDPATAKDDWVVRSLTAISPGEPVAVDPAGPVLVDLLRIAVPDLPADDPGNPHRSGATYYRSGYFDLTVRLTDVASGETGEVTYTGRLHADYTDAGDDTFTASSYVWLGASALNVGLGGNLYTLSPPGGHYAHVAGQFEVWVGGNAPAPLPEPGTLALAGLGLAPLAVRLGRRWRG